MMRFVIREGPSTIGLNYMWLPTWLGLQTNLLREMRDALEGKFKGLPLTEQLLDEAHHAVIEFLRLRFPAIEGLWEYLDGLKYVRLQ